MRKTLVFRGVNEELNENWATTEHKLIEIIKENTTFSPQVADRIIERAHRVKRSFNNNNNSNNNNNNNFRTSAPPLIFAKFYDWKDAQRILDEFRNNNLRNNSKIYVDQLYSPLLSARRNEALTLRKELKAEKKIISGYIAYPAILMVKKTGDTKYSKHQSF